jgi:hypothetical protein
VLCILQLYIQFVGCELFLQLYNIVPYLPVFSSGSARTSTLAFLLRLYQFGNFGRYWSVFFSWTPYYIHCSRHTLYRYILCYSDSFVSRSFPIFESVQQIFLRKLFPQFLFVIFLTWVLVQISDVSQERGSGRFILDQIQTLIFRLSILPLKMVEYPRRAPNISRQGDKNPRRGQGVLPCLTAQYRRDWGLRDS